jgi:hypothetical protein
VLHLPDDRAEVLEVRPAGNADVEPSFVAACECDWLGDVRQSSEEAMADARAHAKIVSTEVVRPGKFGATRT